MSGKFPSFTKWFLSLCLLTGTLCLAAESVTDEPKTNVDPPAGEKAEEPGTKEQPGTKDESGTKDETETKDEAELEAEDDEAAAVARPVSADPVQVFGWMEWCELDDGKSQLKVAAKLDTGAYTSSVHAEEKKLFERDGKKWVRFVVSDPRNKEAGRIRIEAPLVRIARVKELGGGSQARGVVRRAIPIGQRKLKPGFTLSDRSNMRSRMRIGRTTIRELGWVDPSRAFIAEEKVMR